MSLGTTRLRLGSTRSWWNAAHETDGVKGALGRAAVERALRRNARGSAAARARRAAPRARSAATHGGGAHITLATLKRTTLARDARTCARRARQASRCCEGGLTDAIRKTYA